MGLIKRVCGIVTLRRKEAHVSISVKRRASSFKAVTSARTDAILCRRFGFEERKIGAAWEEEEDTLFLEKFGALSFSFPE